MGWSSSCEVARGPKELTDRLWQLIVAHHTGDYPDNVDDEEDSELDEVIDDYGTFLDRTKGLMEDLSRRGACISAHSVKYEFTDALWDEIEPFLNKSNGIEQFLHDDCEGISYVRISDFTCLLGNLSGTERVKSRMQRALNAAVEQFERDDHSHFHPCARPGADPVLAAAAHHLRSTVCTNLGLKLDERRQLLISTIKSMEQDFRQAQSMESASRDDCRNNDSDYDDFEDDCSSDYDDDDFENGCSSGYGTQRLFVSGGVPSRMWEKRRIAYQFAIDHLQEALQACHELEKALDPHPLSTPSPPRSSQPAGVGGRRVCRRVSTQGQDSAQAMLQRNALSKRELLQQICREAATAGEHVIVVHSVI